MEILVGAAATAATGGAAATAATAGIFGTAGAVTAGGLLSGGLTAASMFGSIAGGFQESAILKYQAKQSDLNASYEKLKGRQQALTIKRQLTQDLASQNAIFTSRGVLTGEGSALAAQESSRQNASDDIETARFGADMNAAAETAQAAQYRSAASTAKLSGFMSAGKTFAGSRAGMSLLGGL